MFHQSVKHSITSGEDPAPLTTSKLGNLQVQDGDHPNTVHKVCHIIMTLEFEDLLIIIDV